MRSPFIRPAGQSISDSACQAAYDTYLQTHPVPIAGVFGMPPDTTSYGAFAVTRPDCAAWAAAQASSILSRWQAVQPNPQAAIRPQTQPATTIPSWLPWAIVGGLALFMLTRSDR